MPDLLPLLLRLVLLFSSVSLPIRLGAAVIMVLTLGPISLRAQEPYHAPSELKKLSVEELLDMDITSVSKYPEKLSAAAAAISVLTPGDIERSGATNIPDALRLVPGLDVAQLDAHTWAISSRGFNDVFANKLLVLMDGRTLYTPLFSGVFWEIQDTFLQDIDRIEVIRGPGATLWGANAVNGVININTKSARDTQGLLLYGGGGTEELGFGGVRYGTKINDDTFVRIYTKYFSRDSSVFPNDRTAHDAWDMLRGGFRLDWTPTREDTITLQGDIYDGREDEMYTVPTAAFPFVGRISSRDNVAGGNVLGRWTERFSADSDLTVQAYYDRTVRNTAVFDETRDTGDIDLQHRSRLGDRQEIIWGAGFRATHDNVKNSLNISLIPDSRTLKLYSAFVQDDITLVPDRLRLSIGSKFEHNDFTGFEVQPSGRISWTPERSQTVWASISRAVRTPSVAESDIRLNPAPPLALPPGTLTIFGNPDLLSEELLAYELGYRWQPIERLTFDLAGFYNDYDNLRSIEPLTPGPVGPSRAENGLFGETYGGELSAKFQVLKQWRLEGSYSYLKAEIHRDSGSRDMSSEHAVEGSSPQNQFSLRSLIDLPWNLQFDSTFRYADSLPAPHVRSYLTLDARLGWYPRKQLELALVGRNLLDDRHPEFAPTFVGTQRAEVQRSVYATVVWHF
jgi:iron complex outermembrane receptor protein